MTRQNVFARTFFVLNICLVSAVKHRVERAAFNQSCVEHAQLADGATTQCCVCCLRSGAPPPQEGRKMEVSTIVCGAGAGESCKDAAQNLQGCVPGMKFSRPGVPLGDDPKEQQDLCTRQYDQDGDDWSKMNEEKPKGRQAPPPGAMKT
eukprot:TRINITY_DN10917_c0_g1_i1.p1 TRINITY_DN10917_c0_g1~~TRINITY_DN10917_c0_g1_i1.p1  ORF type:complete len:172 (-),score=15.20 TRINITY_DN10917_c0_g1_i1:89-535(-)